tara:strand:- start:1538 stop:2374 length:837 start_codon:yes stop_codon:yes gene_type:complete
MKQDIKNFITNAIKEDIGFQDISSEACIKTDVTKKAKIISKEDCIIAGIDITKKILNKIDKKIKIKKSKKDGDEIKKQETIMIIEGPIKSILKAERISLNIMQRMSGIATKTNRIKKIISKTNSKILDTRKTTPGFRMLEKKAVKIGGGENHRFGLYDVIMIKENHIKACGGIKKAIIKLSEYNKNKKYNVIIEVKNIDELKEVLNYRNHINRILLDNFDIIKTKQAIKIIKGKIKTESSGNIDENNILEYAKTGTNYISLGCLTHSIKSIDLSLYII